MPEDELSIDVRHGSSSPLAVLFQPVRSGCYKGTPGDTGTFPANVSLISTGDKCLLDCAGTPT